MRLRLRGAVPALLFLASLLMAPVAATAVAAPVPFPPPPPTVTVTGTVTDALLGGPIKGVSVIASTGASGQTSSSGVYSLKLPGGTSTLTFRASTYHTGSTTVVVTIGKTAPPVNVALRPYEFDFTGNVTNASSGDPISDAYVLLTPGNLATTTAPDGSFSIGVENGTFTATVSAPHFASVAWPLRVAGQPLNHAFPLNSTVPCGNCSAPPATGGGGGGNFPSVFGLTSAGTLLVVVLAVVIGVLGTTAFFLWRTRVQGRAGDKSLAALPMTAEDPGARDPDAAARRRAHHRRR